MSWGMEPPKCRTCGRLIRFIRTKAGKNMPCESFSVWVVPSGNGKLFYKENGEAVRGYFARRDSVGAVEAWEPHWGFCKDPKKEKNAVSPREEERRIMREKIEKERAAEAARAQRREEKRTKAETLEEAKKAQMTIFGGNWE